MRVLKFSIAAAAPLVALSQAATAAQVTIEVEAEVFSIFTPGAGEIQIVENVNDTGVTLELGDTVRAVLTYDSDVAGFVVDGEPGAGALGDTGIYGTPFGPAPILEAEFFIDGQLVQSTRETVPVANFAFVLDSFTAGTLDYLEFAVSFPAPPPSLDGWGLMLALEEPGNLGSAALPSTLPAVGWRYLDPGNPAQTQWAWTWGVVTTPSTAAGHAEFDAFATTIRINPGDFVQGDLNGDRLLDASDFQIWSASFARCAGDLGYLAEGDFSGDGCVDFADYQHFISFFAN